MMDTYSLLAVSEKIKTSDAYDFQVDQEVTKLLKDSYDRVKVLLKKNEKGLKNLAAELIKNETLDAKQVKEIILDGKLKTHYFKDQ